METKEKTIGQIVADNYKTAAIFESFGIDFCCKGNKSIDEACNDKGINKTLLLHDLEKASELNTGDANNEQFITWEASKLAEYIEKKHHKYVEEKTPLIKQYLSKICQVHGHKHPELHTVRELFNESAWDLTVHMKKEEIILFPFIRKLTVIKSKQQVSLGQQAFNTIQNPVDIMKHDHTIEGERFDKIAALTNNFTPPPDACNTYKVTFALLKEFVDDLHLHIHLENNILFPKAIELEEKLK